VRKVLVIVLTALFVAGLSVPSFAAKASGKKAEGKNFERIVAIVDSIDPATRKMVVTREENGESRTITISEKAAAQVKVGDRVRIKLKAGTNESAGVRVLGAKPVADAAVDLPADAASEPEKQ
jgi:hypothetical protein